VRGQDTESDAGQDSDGHPDKAEAGHGKQREEACEDRGPLHGPESELDSPGLGEPLSQTMGKGQGLYPVPRHP